MVDTESRSIRCTCRPCGILFAREGSSQGRLKTVPDRWLFDPAEELTATEWAALQIPVRLAFFSYHSGLQRWAAFYPGPAGATESLLGLDAWGEMARVSRLVRAAQPDVEAILVFSREDGGFDRFLVPIHACYELVGRVKRHWKGFEGGTAVWREIGAWFDQARSRSRPFVPAGNRS